MFSIYLSLFSILLTFLAYLYSQGTIKLLKNKLKLSFEETLELATSDQLKDELQKRPIPCIILFPSKNKEEIFTVEVHCLSPQIALDSLELAVKIMEVRLESSESDEDKFEV